jgi:hypothetical protein
MTDTNRVSLYVLEEATWGTTPASGAFQELRYTGESLVYNVETASSSQIRSDRNVSDVVRTQASTSGDVQFELSYGSFDTLLEGLMMSDWASDVLKNGTTLKSYSVEKNFEGLGKFHTFKGLRVSSMSLDMGAGEMVTGSFAFIGKGITTSTSSASTGTPQAANNNSVFNAVNNVTVLKEGGSSYSDKVMSLSLNVENNLRANQAIASLEPTRIGFGQFNVSGSMSVYFQNQGVFDKFVNGTDSSIEFSLSDGTNDYTVLIPKVEYTAANVTAGGANSDVMAEVEFTAKYDSVNNCTLKISR